MWTFIWKNSGNFIIDKIIYAFQVYPMDPPNDTDPDETIKRVQENDPTMTDLNWNNIKVLHFKSSLHLPKYNSNVLCLDKLLD